MFTSGADVGALLITLGDKIVSQMVKLLIC